MINAVITQPDELPGLYRFDSWEDFHRATFSPELCFPVAVWEAGRYTRKKDTARQQLRNLQDAASLPGLSWGELAQIQARAENVARRAGLLREARESGIC